MELIKTIFELVEKINQLPLLYFGILILVGVSCTYVYNKFLWDLLKA
ncbi:hypothetical protein BCG9842_0171 (plasmid) [Bacillus cereus G9842]|uniref:Uncharacterized protein n=1 Tax=Bacillus cereus (strain G9842) TaxID=405531 RepID=B7IYW1_BACC2|nr:hypothetical protein BCG9842_0171 [Bacillus cereus G9842]